MCPVGYEAEAAGLVGAVPEDVARKVSHLLTQASSALWEIYRRRSGPSISLLDRSDALIAVAGGEIDGAASLGLAEAEAAAHRLGALVVAVGDPVLASTVREQLRADVEALRAAASGMFTGRAGQAVPLDRGSPVAEQVLAGEMALAADPLTPLWSAGVGPVSACVAVARWLVVAAEVTGAAAGMAPTTVFAAADAMAPPGTDLPAEIVGRIHGGVPPEHAVTRLLGTGRSDFSTSPVSGGQDLLDQLLLGMAGCALVFMDAHADEDLRSADRDRHARSRDRLLDLFRAEVRNAAAGDGYA
jgi:hypothetical protein